jgi:branched-chain amino acid transport system ATP-binding protein
VQAVQGVSLQVRRGECLSIVGANGAGKTSLLRGLSGLEPAGCEGAIELEGRSLRQCSAARRARLGLGHVLENRHVFAHLSVRQNLELGTHGLPRADAPAALAEVFELLPELEQLGGRLAGTLSGGQQQFLAIGRALVGRPIVLLLDEPTNGLAPVLVNRVIEILGAICEQCVGVLLVEQRLEVAQALGGDVHILQHGLVVHATVAEDPTLADRVHAAYLG